MAARNPEATALARNTTSVDVRGPIAAEKPEYSGYSDQHRTEFQERLRHSEQERLGRVNTPARSSGGALVWKAVHLPVAGGTLDDGANVAVGTGTGTKIGTAVSQKLGFWGATPVVQPSGADQAAVTLGNTDGEISGLSISDPPTQAEVQALRDACEELADDLRNLSTLIHSLRTAAVAEGLVKGSA